MAGSSEVIRRSLERDLANVEDNLYRYQMQARADPSWRTGNGEPISTPIAQLERQRDELRAALESVA